LALAALVKHQLVEVVLMARMVPILFLLLLLLLVAAAGVIMAQSLAQAVALAVARQIVLLVVALEPLDRVMQVVQEIIALALLVAVREQ
jgi:hypothetical protein